MPEIFHVHTNKPPVTMSNLKNACDNTMKLFMKYPEAADWSSNLIQGSAGLKTNEEWDAYVRFLANPSGGIPEIKPAQPIPEVEDEKTQTELPPQLVTEIIENGPGETIVIVKNIDSQEEKHNGERLDPILKCLPKEASEEKHETVHERRSSGVQEEKTEV